MMKTNELMIGDWVNTPNGYGKVKGLYQYELRGQQRNEVIVDTKAELTEFFMPEVIVPIPLTAEILEKNAYPNDGCWYSFGDFYVAHYGDCYVIHQNPDDDKRDFLCIIYNVHELQHALRLCGLDELADNFKI